MLPVTLIGTDREAFVIDAICFPIERPQLGPGFLEVYRDGAVKGVNGQLLADKAFSYEGNPGRAYTVKGTANNIEIIAYVRSILVGHCHYVLNALAQPKRVQPDQSEIDRFFNSFKVVKDM
jgi:hypothetical protein